MIRNTTKDHRLSRVEFDVSSVTSPFFISFLFLYTLLVSSTIKESPISHNVRAVTFSNVACNSCASTPTCSKSCLM